MNFQVAASLKGLLKRGEESTKISVEMTASDLGKPRLQTKKSLEITIKDVNDHAPEFEKVG